ncbi:MAG: AraC family transcriptional regulator [Oceanospirillaceae bacterium]|uniref:AraC family transcriptional regulator n=1 Tax=unclassified Thalassolituus TaxID=2624967 RepID=UPI000C56FF7F|nr:MULTISPECIES: AraC family transcriptional regulator [unclassified Thalassolituus]MAX98691.1 AraC family transcriptional regulator [Oceanospirillaceae bacterium]MBS52363.1 AraC family transcriptional regulator [Oceanospirillaceae bacterium]MDK2778683.1 AraC family transcriptional regulator [Pseudomonadota bacterium]
MRSSYSTIAAWPLAVARTLAENGFDAQRFFAAAGLDLTELERQPDSRVPIEVMTGLWQQLEEKTADPAFALQVAAHVQPMHFRALGLLMLSCSNMQQVIDKMGRYHALVSNTVNIRVVHQATRTGFVIDPLAGVPISPLAVDGFFATIVTFARQLTGRTRILDEVELLRSEPPAGGQPWTRLMQCPVRFAAATNCLWFSRSELAAMALPGDEQMAAANEALVEQYLHKMNALSWSERVRNSLQAMLEQGEPGLADIAQVFNLSERTLRRYLQQENTSYRQLLEEVRREMAQYWLRRPQETITSVALRLGFSDSSNFSRAFQRWFQQTPGQFRRGR